MTHLNWGKANRLERLRKSGDYFLLLALDHGLSSGPLDGIIDVGRWVEFAKSHNVPAVVLNRGMVPWIPLFGHASLILQTAGMPDPQGVGYDKSPLATIEDALRLSADAVSVQLRIGTDSKVCVLEKISKIVSLADRFSLPVLFMLNLAPADLTCQHIAFCVRVCTELGADLIKVALPNGDISPEHNARFRDVLRASPPVLFAGGLLSPTFNDSLELAATLGFQGTCVGRNLFQAADPVRVLSLIHQTFTRQLINP